MAYRTQKVLLVFLGIPWLLLLGGCATFPTSEPVTLREQWLSYFKSCAPQDGAHSIQLFKDGNLMGAAELEWVARSDTDWEIELTNNLGQIGRAHV